MAGLLDIRVPLLMALVFAYGCGESGSAGQGRARARPAPPAEWLDLDPEQPGLRLRDPRTGLVFRRVEPGSFEMGRDRAGEGPRHTVQITRPYLIAETELPASVFRQYLEASKSPLEVEGMPGGNLPAPVSFQDAVEFCAFYGYRLPTEAEWEFACLGGRSPDDPRFDDPDLLGEEAWFHTNAGDGGKPIATRQPNPLGLYDMLGNLWEWCSDFHAHSYQVQGDPQVDPKGPEGGAGRVLRGGSWFTIPGPVPQTRTPGAENERNDFYGMRPVVDA